MGDDDYDGPENSQLQKATDGLEILFEFENLETYSKLRITFDAKGLQSDLFEIPSSIDYGSSDNNILLEKSPYDGSFDTYSFEIDNNQLYNSLIIRTTNVGRFDLNYDDWEFSSLFIEGIE